MINDETIDRTIIELGRTMATLKALKAARARPNNQQASILVNVMRITETIDYRPKEVKEHAAAMRASMDLTRALADLRAGR